MSLIIMIEGSCGRFYVGHLKVFLNDLLKALIWTIEMLYKHTYIFLNHDRKIRIYGFKRYYISLGIYITHFKAELLVTTHFVLMATVDLDYPFHGWIYTKPHSISFSAVMSWNSLPINLRSSMKSISLNN